MISFGLILSTLYALTGSPHINSKVLLEGEITICEITYTLPSGSTAPAIQYKKINDPEWEVKLLSGTAGHTRLSNLADGEIYVARLAWEEKGIRKETDDHHFVTYSEILPSQADFTHFKIIKSTERTTNYIHKLYHSKLSFEYADKYRSNALLTVEIVDATNLVVARFFTEKTPDGIYHIDFSSFSVMVDETYEVRLRDGKNPDRSFKATIANPEEEFHAAIDVNPMLVDCENGGNSSVQFFSNTTGGNAPLEVSWSLTSIDASTLLFGPEKQVLKSADDVSTISVELALPYVVTMSAFDACGLFQEYTVVLSCNNEGNEDAVLIQLLNDESTTGSGSN